MTLLQQMPENALFPGEKYRYAGQAPKQGDANFERLFGWQGLLDALCGADLQDATV